MRQIAEFLTIALLVATTGGCVTAPPRPTAPAMPTPEALDAKVRQAMAATGAQGLAIALVDDGRVVDVQAHGKRTVHFDSIDSIGLVSW